MDIAEYANLATIENEHWYYAGKREVVRTWLKRVGPPASGQTLLDFGAGTGSFARGMEPFCRVLVLDDHEEALRLLRGHFRPEQILVLVQHFDFHFKGHDVGGIDALGGDPSDLP